MPVMTNAAAALLSVRILLCACLKNECAHKTIAGGICARREEESRYCETRRGCVFQRSTERAVPMENQIDGVASLLSHQSNNNNKRRPVTSPQPLTHTIV